MQLLLCATETNSCGIRLRNMSQNTYLVNRDSVHVSVVHKPDDLVGEEFSVVLRRQVRLSRFTGVQLKAFPDSLPQHIQGGIGFHDLCHGLLDERFHSWKPVSKGTAGSNRNSYQEKMQMKMQKKIKKN